MKKMILVLAAALLAPLAVEAQQGQGAGPTLSFDTSVFREGQNSQVGRIVAKVRLAYLPAEETEHDEGELCIALGIEPDPRSILKGYLSFLHTTVDEKGKERREKVGVKLKGKPYKDDGIEFWAECAPHPEPKPGDELKIFIRQPRKEMQVIRTHYPDVGEYRWVTVTHQQNGGILWTFNTTPQDAES